MRKLLLITIFFALSACSKKKEEAASLVREIPASSPEQALKLAEEATLRCEDSARCPTNVGLFVATNGSSVLTCTSFLIGEDLLATNSHCLPSVVKQLPDLCAERIHVILPAGPGKAEEKFACKELIGASQRPNAISPDLALLRLEKATGRIPLPLNLLGVETESLHTAFKINPGDGASGTLVAQSCRTVKESYRFPDYRGKTDPIFITGDCPSKPGNSGAPLLNGAGEVVGAFQAELPYSDRQKQAWSPYLLPGEEFAPLALGTSLLCLTSKTGWNWNPACAPIDDENIIRPRIDDFPALSAETDLLLQKEISRLPKLFQWKRTPLTHKTLERTETLSPDCFLHPRSWLDNFSLPAGDYEPEAILKPELPILESKIFFNRYMQVSARSRLVEMQIREIRFQPAALAATGISEILEEGLETGSIGICP